MRRTVQNLRHLSCLVVFSAASVLLFGCRGQAAGPDVVVTVDNDEMHYSQFESYLRDNVDSSDLPLEQPVLEKLFDQFLDEWLLMRLARERGLGSGGPGQPPIDQRTAVTYLLNRARLQPLDEAEVVAYYEVHRREFERPERVKLHQILVHKRENAEAVLEALASGEDFTQVAARFSQVPMTNLGDEALTREDLPEAFADSIFELAPGEISEVFDADYGFHVFQVVERFSAEAMPLEEVAGEIRSLLERRRLDELVASFVEEARGRYNVRIHLSNFPFEYRGFYAERKHF